MALMEIRPPQTQHGASLLTGDMT